MGYTALYRKFRPQTFSELVGQEHITRTLKNQIIANRVGHAYLFNGGRGTGKTSSAKILARAINCLNPKDGEPCNECEICKGAISGALTDIVEMDAASNNSVEDIRGIREEVNFLPTKAKYRVYIIDEVHMLSPGAFNALLKTLEEPPEHVKFILATTEPQKIPATILSRCQRYDFKRISDEDIVKRLKEVCNKSDIKITEGALKIISVLSEGAMRDALSILERCVQDGQNNIDEDKIKDLVGIPKTVFVNKLVKSVVNKNVEEALNSINEILNQGKDLQNFIWEIIKYIKDILIFKTSGNEGIYNESEIKDIKEIAQKVTKEDLVNLIYEMSNLENDIKWSTQKTIIFEAGIIKLCSNQLQDGKDIEERISKIENYLKSGGTVYKNIAINNSSNNQNVQNNIIESNNKQNMNLSNNINNVAKPQKAIEREKKDYSRNLNESWPKIVNNLKQSGKIVLYTNLLNTKAEEINDMTVGIKFFKEVTPFGKAVLEKPENLKEISDLVSMACGKEMQIKYILENQGNVKVKEESDIQRLAKESNIQFNVIE